MAWAVRAPASASPGLAFSTQRRLSYSNNAIIRRLQKATYDPLPRGSQQLTVSTTDRREPIFQEPINSMPASAWEFDEAIESFRVIESSLRCIYAGEIHMYRALSAQLRILLCDSPKPLLTRLFSNLQLQSLQPVKSYQPGDFPPELEHLNSVAISGPGEFVISCMPFEARVYVNGVEDCRPLLEANGALLSLDKWVDQLVSVHPVPVTIRRVIKTVADRGGGAHVHTSKDALLSGLQSMSPGKLHLAARVVIAVSKVMQQFGFAVTQHYEKNGTKAGLPLAAIDSRHPSVIASAKVPEECLRSPYQAFNLISVGPV